MLVCQEFGNLGTILVALPIALLLGFKREAVGMTHSIAREKNRPQPDRHARRKSYNFQSTGNSTWPPFLSS